MTLTHMRYAIPFLLLLVTYGTNHAQQLSINTAISGNGPLLGSLRLTNAMAVPTQTDLCGSSTKNQYLCCKQVEVRFSFSGKITEYRYKGKTYPSALTGKNIEDCAAFCSECSGTLVKVTARIKAGNETFTQTRHSSSVAGVHHILINLNSAVPAKTVSLVSLTVEPVPYANYDSQLAFYEACQEKKKEDKKEKETPAEENKKKDDSQNNEKQPGKNTVNKIDNDFWNGKKSPASSSKNPGTNIDNDFWSGKKLTEKKTGNAGQNEFQIKKEEIDNSIYSWVEDANGKIIIPKGPYQIVEFKNGLAKVEKLIRTDRFDYVKNKTVTVTELYQINGEGEKIPPARYSVKYAQYFNPLTLYDSKMTRAQIDASKDRNRQKDRETYARLKSYYQSIGISIE